MPTKMWILLALPLAIQAILLGLAIAGCSGQRDFEDDASFLRPALPRGLVPEQAVLVQLE